MNILVLDVAATESGALTMLRQYYDEFKQDTGNHYYLCVSTPEFANTDNITVLKFPWVKKSWLHRLHFGFFYVNELVKKYNIVRVFSLQNLIIRNPHCEKWIYMHQSIPFAGVEFSLIRETKLWVYRHIIGALIKRSLAKANHIVVQSEWIKDAIASSCGIDKSLIEVRTPTIDREYLTPYVDRKLARRTLFYPATAFKYKNQMIILEAMKSLLDSGKLGEITLLLTIKGDENDYARAIYDFARSYALPVNFIGELDKRAIFEKYASTTLVFPSYIETFGLPLLEAREAGCYILASDTPFSHEILDEYARAQYFAPQDAAALAEKIAKII